MCNLYSVTKGQQPIRDAFRVMVDRAGNMPPLPAIFPDQMAPVVRHGADGRELAMLRWGFPSPPGVPGNRAVTNIRNTGSSYWRSWMQPAYRCLVPVTAFCDYASGKPAMPQPGKPAMSQSGKPAMPHWFALGEDRPLLAFAGLWRPWSGVRGTKAGPAEGEHHLFAFLTCEPNAVVAPIHPKAMPVVLTTSGECDAWMTAPIADALLLQRPLADGTLSVVARSDKQDPPAAPPAMKQALLL